MFSYRHAFHAGNHADVLKHLVLLQVLDYLNRKDAPWWLIDTHAGAGIYDLGSDWARRSGEAGTGIRRVFAAASQAQQAQDETHVPAPVRRYLDALQAVDAQAATIARTDSHKHAPVHHNASAPLRWYAGSPWLGLHAMRAQDRLRLFERHPSESQVLAHNIGCLSPSQQRRIELRHADGFGGMAALLPPPARRGLVLIDPSYEDKRDYRRVLQTVRDALRRFGGGSYFIWHPLVWRLDVAKEIDKLVRGGKGLAPDWLHVTLRVAGSPVGAQGRRDPSGERRDERGSGHGLCGSGVLLINPPWTLAARLRETLPWLTHALAQDAQAAYQLHTGTPASPPARRSGKGSV